MQKELYRTIVIDRYDEEEDIYDSFTVQVWNESGRVCFDTERDMRIFTLHQSVEEMVERLRWMASEIEKLEEK